MLVVTESSAVTMDEPLPYFRETFSSRIMGQDVGRCFAKRYFRKFLGLNHRLSDTEQMKVRPLACFSALGARGMFYALAARVDKLRHDLRPRVLRRW